MNAQSNTPTLGNNRVLFGVMLLAGMTIPQAAWASSEQPNIILIVADDLGWNDVGYHGSELATPNLDRLARLGAELDQFYVQPTCTPTRAALMTGRYPFRYGMHARVCRWWHSKGLPLSARLLPEQLQRLGYATAICGKWHLGMASCEYLPMARGFDRQYGHLGGHIDYFRHTAKRSLDWHRNQSPLREEGYSTRLVGEEAVHIIESHDDSRPLFLYLAFNAPHAPQQAPREAIEEFADIEGTRRRVYAAMVSCMDKAIGRVADTVEARGWSDQTIILFFSDNGGAINTAASNAPLRGRKGQLYEGGVRVPAFAYWDGVIDSGTLVKTPLHVVDVLPTLVGLAGGTPAPAIELDGRDAWPVIGLGQQQEDRLIVLNVRRDQGAVRQGDWKLVRNGEANMRPPVTELFNLRDDPNEKNDLAARLPQKAIELTVQMDAMRKHERDPDGLEVRAQDGVIAPDVWDFTQSKTGGIVRPASVISR